MANIPLMMRIMASSVSVANRAGRIIREVMCQGDLGIVEKGKDDLQTEADRSAQSCIIASLLHQYPNMTVIGEEGAMGSEPVPSDWLITQLDEEMLNYKCPDVLENITEEDVVVWVDPLDGTTEYTQGFLEHVTVLIGISVHERAVGGIIHQPYYTSANCDTPGRTIWGLQGLGVGGFTPQSPPDSLVITTTRSHSNQLIENCLQALNADRVLRVGGAGYKVLQLLEGIASVYIFASRGYKKWDTCAPEAVLKAAGGVLTDIQGQEYKYGASAPPPNAGGVLAASNEQLHADILQRIPAHLKNALN